MRPATQATAEGVLSRTPVPHLVVYVLDRRLTGSLYLGDPAGTTHVVQFERGVAVKALCGDGFATLGRVLVDAGRISPEVHDASLARLANEGGLHGQLLLRAGALSAPELDEALQLQLYRKLAHLFTLAPSTPYAYHDGVLALSSHGGPEPVRIDPLAALWGGLREHVEPDVVERTLARVSAATLRVHPRAQLRRFGFVGEERTAVELVQARPARFSELLASGGVDANLMRRVLYTLLITRHLDAGGGALPVDTDGEDRPAAAAFGASLAPPPLSSPSSLPAASMVPTVRARPSRGTPESGSAGAPSVRGIERPPSSVRAPPASAADLQARRELIKTRAAHLDRETHFELLDITEEHPISSVQAAYFAHAKQWHPDRLPPELADVRDEAARIFAAMSKAFQTLSDPVRRREYLEQLAAKEKSDGTEVERAIRAMSLFKHAELLLKREDLAAARRLCEQAREADPEQPDYIAMSVWIRSHDAGADLPRLVKELDEVLDRHEKHVNARFYRAMLFKRMGKEELAQREFRAVTEVAPSHIDAQREIRLHQMRQPSGGGRKDPGARPTQPPTSQRKTPPRSEIKGTGGLLDKIFKR